MTVVIVLLLLLDQLGKESQSEAGEGSVIVAELNVLWRARVEC